MPIGSINTDELVAAVTEAEGVEASVLAFIQNNADATKTAVAAAILAEDDSAQATVDAANIAIQQQADRMKKISSTLANAVTTTPVPPAA